MTEHKQLALEAEIKLLKKSVDSQKYVLGELRAENARLREALQYVHDDLLLRAGDGLVAVGGGCWGLICRTLQESGDE